MMNVFEFLEKFAAEYTLEERGGGVCVEEISARRRGLAAEAAKAVVIKADGKHYMCVLPVYCMVDLEVVRAMLGARRVEIVEPEEIASLFPSCQAGAESPFGILYGLPTLMDRSLEEDSYIVFQGERYDKAILMSMAEYKRLASPRIFSFCHPGS